ncbi:MAG: TIM barrel protein [Caldilineaceae bacterium]
MICVQNPGYEAMMAEIEQEIGLATVGCWHFNDSKGKLGSHVDRHEHIGEGEIGLAGFGHIINDAPGGLALHVAGNAQRR